MGSPLQGYTPQRRISFDVLKPAWMLFQQEPATWLLATLLIAVIGGAVATVLGSVTFGIGGVVAGVPFGVLMVGAYRMAFKQLRSQTIAIGDLFAVQDVLGPSAIAGLVISLLMAIGSALCIVPGLVASGLLMFALPLVADRKMDGIEAMKLSFETLKDEWLMAGVFCLVLTLIATVGMLACGVGILVAGPIILLGQALLYRAYFPETAAPAGEAPAPDAPSA
jgi:uncharacterized membrane protein